MVNDDKTRKPLHDTAGAAGAPAAEKDVNLTEREEFIFLLKCHPECYPALRRILAPQERQHEERETPHHND